MSQQTILVPDIGDFAEVEVIEVLVAVGDTVSVDDPLLTLESDKASMDIPAPRAGTVRELRIGVGDKVSAGDEVLVLDDAAAGDAPAVPAAPVTDEAAPPTAPPATPSAMPAPPAVDRVHASPSVRRLARERHVDLNRVTGSGRKGRVTREDVLGFVASPAAPATSSPSPRPSPGAADFSRFGEVERMPLSRIKRLSGAHLARAWQEIPHVTHQDEADITALEAFRQSLKPRAEQAGVRVTLLAFVMQALAATLKAFPTFNASLDEGGEALVLKKYVHLGIAVDTPGGLVVPVIRDVDRKGLFALSAELMSVSAKAREKKLKPEDMAGGSMTISSLGGIGGTAFTPIVNAPEVAILGLTRAREMPFRGADDGIDWRLVQPLSLSYDHRVIDGAEAARFCRHLADLLADVRLLLT